MPFSYSGLRTKQKYTLPSNDNWGTNLNILKDPPKSLHLRRVKKVGEGVTIDNNIVNDRINESILLYPRGINPSVAISFSNMSNNGGQLSGADGMGKSVFGKVTSEAKLPYKVFDNEAFRPHIRRYEEKFPLSRQPVDLSGYSYTAPLSNDNVVIRQKNNEKYKMIISEPFKVNDVRPNEVFKFKQKLDLNLDKTRYLQRNITNNVSTDKRKLEHFQIINHDALNKIKSTQSMNVLTNKSGSNTKDGISEIFKENYVQPILKGEYQSNISKGIGIDAGRLMGNKGAQKFMVKNPPTIDYKTNIRRRLGVEERYEPNKENYVQKLNKYNFNVGKTANYHVNTTNNTYKSFNVERNLPLTNYNTQKTRVNETFDLNGRNYKIKRERNYGGYFNGGNRKTFTRPKMY